MSQPKPTILAIPQPLAQALLDHILQAPTGGHSVRSVNQLLDGLTKLQPIPEAQGPKVEESES